ncbi:hypothetical protein D3OALGB2SA_1850 [Olavius algarvensis associated proteobacterium Delta 3]|nr:hypothetical protein D3OALGB2SA_1850 [Olavius algarvensis associated proteobacterium Delta 3]
MEFWHLVIARIQDRQSTAIDKKARFSYLSFACHLFIPFP